MPRDKKYTAEQITAHFIYTYQNDKDDFSIDDVFTENLDTFLEETSKKRPFYQPLKEISIMADDYNKEIRDTVKLLEKDKGKKDLEAIKAQFQRAADKLKEINKAYDALEKKYGAKELPLDLFNDLNNPVAVEEDEDGPKKDLRGQDLLENLGIEVEAPKAAAPKKKTLPPRKPGEKLSAARFIDEVKQDIENMVGGEGVTEERIAQILTARRMGKGDRGEDRKLKDYLVESDAAFKERAKELEKSQPFKDYIAEYRKAHDGQLPDASLLTGHCARLEKSFAASLLKRHDLQTLDSNLFGRYQEAPGKYKSYQEFIEKNKKTFPAPAEGQDRKEVQRQAALLWAAYELGYGTDGGAADTGFRDSRLQDRAQRAMKDPVFRFMERYYPKSINALAAGDFETFLTQAKDRMAEFRFEVGEDKADARILRDGEFSQALNDLTLGIQTGTVAERKMFREYEVKVFKAGLNQTRFLGLPVGESPEAFDQLSRCVCFGPRKNRRVNDLPLEDPAKIRALRRGKEPDPSLTPDRARVESILSYAKKHLAELENTRQVHEKYMAELEKRRPENDAGDPPVLKGEAVSQEKLEEYKKKLEEYEKKQREYQEKLNEYNEKVEKEKERFAAEPRDPAVDKLIPRLRETISAAEAYLNPPQFRNSWMGKTKEQKLRDFIDKQGAKVLASVGKYVNTYSTIKVERIEENRQRLARLHPELKPQLNPFYEEHGEKGRNPSDKNPSEYSKEYLAKRGPKFRAMIKAAREYEESRIASEERVASPAASMKLINAIVDYQTGKEKVQSGENRYRFDGSMRLLASVTVNTPMEKYFIQQLSQVNKVRGAYPGTPDYVDRGTYFDGFTVSQRSLDEYNQAAQDVDEIIANDMQGGEQEQHKPQEEKKPEEELIV